MSLSTVAQSTPAGRACHVDRGGVLRWNDDDTEVALFGVNYYTPFHWNYADIQRLGLNHRRVIDTDVAHFQRMGLDLIRLHVFDREISDEQGNLIDNEHLAILDYLLFACKLRGIHALLTPIAWWACPGETHGFSDRYPMEKMTTDPEAWRAQARYLRQFCEHVNRYTKQRYADDPVIIAFELINEPHYPSGMADAQVTAYINSLYAGVRASGARQPVFFNAWAGKAAATAASRAEGVTFGWYPSGLVSGHSLRRNFLPVVADYPRMRDPLLRGKAIAVYEFDAADIPGSYIYPAMARAFRAGGAQLAAQFQYDPLPLAPTNTGWQTHYLNLVYDPAQAVSFMVAAEAFHRLPRHHHDRSYPGNNRFGPFHVSHQQDLSEVVADDIFYYSNNTSARPPHPERLRHIAGVGSSPVLQYDGTGVYFLDRESSGNWALTVYPDAVWVNDPFGRSNLKREVSRLVSREHRIRVRLPGLQVDDLLAPGVYRLRAGQRSATFVRALELERPRARQPAIWLQAPPEWTRNEPMPVEVTIAADREPDRPSVVTLSDEPWQSFPLQRKRPYQYETTLPAASLRGAELRLGVTLGDSGKLWAGNRMLSTAEARRLLSAKPMDIFLAGDLDALPGWTTPPPPDLSHTCELRNGALRLEVGGFSRSFSATGVQPPARRVPAPPAGPWDILIEARATAPGTHAIEVGFIQSDGAAYGVNAPLSGDWSQVRVPVESLRLLWGTHGEGFKPQLLRQISLVFGSWLYGSRAGERHGFELRRIQLAPRLPGWRTPLLSPDAPVDLFRAARDHVRVHGVPANTRTALLAPGGRSALIVEVPRFGPPPACVSFRTDMDTLSPKQRRLAAHCRAIAITARATQPDTNKLEVVVLEDDDTPWGVNITLADQWQTIVVPLSELRYWEHWRGQPLSPVDRRPDPARLSAVSLCFGAWLFPDRQERPHGIAVERVSLVREPQDSQRR